MEVYDKYPIGTSDCFNIGINGECNFNCSVLQNGECKYFKDSLNSYTKEQLNYLYDNGFYEKEIKKYLKLN